MLRPTVRTRTKPHSKPQPKRDTERESGEGADDVTDKICATLAGAIAERALKPGLKILEDEIADHFGISRTAVRGALGILQRDHLLERKRNRGTFVAAPSIAEAKDLFESRRALERAILERVIQRATAADFDRLDIIVAGEQRVHDASDEAAKKSLSGQFHIELARLGRNEVMTELLGKVVARISLVMALYEDELHDDCGTDHHREIIADLRRHDLAAAQRRMDGHLADLEGRVCLTQAQGDRDAFVSVLKSFSSRPMPVAAQSRPADQPITPPGPEAERRAAAPARPRPSSGGRRRP